MNNEEEEREEREEKEENDKEKEKEKSSGINPAFKISVGSNISNPIPDDEYLQKEGNRNLKLLIILIIIDFIVTLIMLLQDYEFLMDVSNTQILEYISRTILCCICFSSLIILLCLHKLIATHIARWAYLILGIIYYCLLFSLRILKLIFTIRETEKSLLLPIIFLILFTGTIAPRIIVFFKSRKYLKKLENLYQIRRLEEQEQFVERIATRIEKGYRRWSNPNVSYSDEETLDDDKTKYLFEKRENNINDNSTDDNNDMGKVEEIMRNSKDNEE